ncbi:Aminoglycoside phosphotransferase [Penicillium sp. CMV-2018d]|nr:Aminoglycoside phosphotransferase [Penicillium sp. CMV-2018d]
MFELVWLITGLWENRHILFLRESLISLFAHWEEFVPGVPYPINFINKDVNLHSKDEENIAGIGKLLTFFRDEAVLPLDGMIDPKDYNTALINSRKLKDIFIGLAKDDEEKELFTKLWLYQEPADTEGL